MRVRTLFITMLAAAGVFGSASPASAHIWPPGCTGNGLDLTINKDRQVVRNGDQVTYTLWAENTKANPCHIDNATVEIFLPTKTGQYSLATPIRLLQNQVYAAGFPYTQIGARSWTVDLDPGVTNAVVLGRASGTLHDIAQDSNFANITKTLGTQITKPDITLDKVGSMTGPAPAPQTVTYTYYVRNGTTPAPPPGREEDVAISNVTVSDDLCANPTYASGDTDGDKKLDLAETWAFTCVATHPSPGTYTNTAVARGENILYNRSVPVQSPPDTWTVVLVPAPPQVAVKPVSVAQPACVLERTSKTTVRAGQLNTIRVRVRNVDAGTTATLTVPGGKQYTAKTDKNGVATFRVRPTKSGTARIEAAECSDVERLSVKPARRVVAQRAPRVTG